MNVSLVGLGKSFGARTLFEGVSLELNPGARYGLVGANGSGKTTLLKILAGAEPASEGSVVIPSGARVSVLRQDLSLDDDERILDLAMMGDGAAWSALRERSRIVDHGEGDPLRLAELEETIRLLEASTLEARATAVLVGLGIPQASHREALGTLSGGFKLRVLLAQVLLGGPDVLFLDEPTNHLDILSIRWLEKFLSGHRGVVLVISHDQRFLENVATHILDVDYGTITAYPGGYASFVVQKEENRARKEAEIARVEKTIADKKAWVERFGAKATKARQAQSRLKQIEKIEEEELDKLEKSTRRTPFFRFEPLRPSGRDVLEVKGVSKAYGTKQVLRDVSLVVRKGERVAIIGPNGLGKSTLLKIVTGRVEADGGVAKFGHETRVSYFAQDHHEILPDPEKTPLDVMWEAVPDESVSYVRGQLGRVLFSGEEVDKRIGLLSGGECARLVFARIAVERPNVLLLDEPTNHLDLEAIAALVAALESFDGTVVFVSHDRAFVSKLATRILEIKPEGFTDFPGTYAEYLARLGDDHLDADAVVLRAKSAAAKDRPAAPASENTTSWEAQKKKRNRLLALPARRDKVLATIETKEARKKAIHEGYAAEGFFERTPAAELEKLAAEEKAIDAEVAELMAEWEAIETELAEAGDEARGAS